MAVVTYKCPNCDGPITFSPERQRFVCDYCLSTFTQQELDKAAPQMGDLHNQPADTAGAGGRANAAGLCTRAGSAGCGRKP